MIRISLILLVFASSATAESLTTTRAIRPATVLAASDLAYMKTSVPGTLESPADAVGLETRTTLYPGRPIRPEDVGPPALVDRNQLVEILYRTDTLTIRTEGRVLDRGASGDRVRVMNLSSRTTVSGVVSSSGRVVVSPLEGSS